MKKIITLFLITLLTVQANAMDWSIREIFGMGVFALSAGNAWKSFEELCYEFGRLSVQDSAINSIQQWNQAYERVVSEKHSLEINRHKQVGVKKARNLYNITRLNNELFSRGAPQPIDALVTRRDQTQEKISFYKKSIVVSGAIAIASLWKLSSKYSYKNLQKLKY